MEKEPDDVSNIHNRFSLTLVNPSSHYFSLVASMIVASVISLTTYFGYMNTSITDEVWYRLPIVLIVLRINTVIRYQIYKEKRIFKVTAFIIVCKYVMGSHTFDGTIS